MADIDETSGMHVTGTFSGFAFGFRVLPAKTNLKQPQENRPHHLSFSTFVLSQILPSLASVLGHFNNH